MLVGEIERHRVRARCASELGLCLRRASCVLRSIASCCHSKRGESVGKVGTTVGTLTRGLATVRLPNPEAFVTGAGPRRPLGGCTGSWLWQGWRSGSVKVTARSADEAGKQVAIMRARTGSQDRKRSSGDRRDQYDVVVADA